MPSPTGIFVGYTANELNDLKQTMLTRMKTGVFTSTSGGGKAGSRVYPTQTMAEVKDALIEINYALRLLGNIPMPKKVTQVVQGCYGE